MADITVLNQYLVKGDRRYTKTHEWILVEGDVGTVGITDYAQKELQDVTYVELPEPGVEVSKGEEVATIESVKHTSPIYTPASGVVVEVNEKLDEEPDIVNRDPYGDGWIFKIKISNPAELNELLSPEEYAALVESEKKS
ncbi:MAG: glycine cleavage system protein GcvH [Desulfurococcales archaeon]|nr:glycine cleavage system protein GcvH [Desulfurococcales archaeon]